MKKTLTIDQMDKLIGFGKPASKTADWIVNTYLPNAPVSNRLSIEHAIAQAIVEASAEPASLGAEAALLERLNALAESLDTPKASCDGRWIAEKIREAIHG